MFQDVNIPPPLLLVAGILVGMIIGSIWTAAVFYPPLAKGIARVKAVALLALGAGLLVWGIVSLASGDEFLQPFDRSPIRSPVECIAWGSGILAAGILSLLYGFIGVFPRQSS